MSNPGEKQQRGTTTTIQVYEEDANWLRARQRAVSFQRNEHIPMFVLVHELIKTVWLEREGS